MQTVMEHAFAMARMRGPAGRLRDYAISAIDRAELGDVADEPPPDVAAMNRLRKHARDAMKQAKDNLIKAQGLFLESLMDDAPAFNELMNVPSGAVRKRSSEYLHRIWLEHHPAETRSGGQGGSDAQTSRAPHGGGATIDRMKPRARVSPAAPSPERLAAERGLRVAYSIMSMMIINGRRMRDCTAEEVLASADKDARHARFKRAVCGGLTPDMVIGEYVDDTTAEQLWKDTENA